MFTIYGGKTEFNQWEKDHRVVNPNMSDCEQVAFRMSNGRTGVSRAYEHEGQMVADVPNHLLKYSGNMMVELGQGKNLRIEETTYFPVTKTEKPEEYEETENRNLKKKYIETVKQDLTEAEKEQARENLGINGTGGGATSWDDLEGKPFGDETPEPITFDGNIDGKDTCQLEMRGYVYVYAKISDKLYTAEELSPATYTVFTDYGGTTAELEKALSFNSDITNLVFDNNAALFCFHEVKEFDLGGITITPPSTGLYSIATQTSVSTNEQIINYVSKITFPEQVKLLDEKYLPESVDGVVIRSSTADSTKKFKLTIDDSGTISATEVTE